jgi:hypothetical protein
VEKKKWCADSDTQSLALAQAALSSLLSQQHGRGLECVGCPGIGWCIMKCTITFRNAGFLQVKAVAGVQSVSFAAAARDADMLADDNLMMCCLKLHVLCTALRIAWFAVKQRNGML